MGCLLDGEEEVPGNGQLLNQIRSSISSLRVTGECLARWGPNQTLSGKNHLNFLFRYVVERFGKLHSIEDSGWFLAVPFVDKIAYIIDIRERAMDIPPQSAITRDNVSVEVSGNLFVRFNDAERAAYGAFNPLYSVTQVRS